MAIFKKLAKFRFWMNSLKIREFTSVTIFLIFSKNYNFSMTKVLKFLGIQLSLMSFMGIGAMLSLNEVLWHIFDHMVTCWSRTGNIKIIEF